jgi:hypothetical protein
MLKNCPNTSLELKKLLFDQLAERRKARVTQRSTRSDATTGMNAQPFSSAPLRCRRRNMLPRQDMFHQSLMVV